MLSTSASKHLLLYLCALSTMTIVVTASFDREKGEIGETNDELDGNCCVDECNLGDFLLDAYLLYGTDVIKTSTDPPMDKEEMKNKPIIAMLNGSAIRGSINKGPITKEQLSKDVLPDPIVMGRVTMLGSDIRRAMENVFEKYERKTSLYEFVQVSGLFMVIDLNREPGKRLYNVSVGLKNLADTTKYIVILSKHMWDHMWEVYGFDKNLEFVEFGKNLLDVAVETISGMKTPIKKQLNGRITLLEIPGPNARLDEIDKPYINTYYGDQYDDIVKSLMAKYKPPRTSIEYVGMDELKSSKFN